MQARTGEHRGARSRPVLTLLTLLTLLVQKVHVLTQKGAASCVAARGEALGGEACTDVLTHRCANTPIYCYRCVAARGEALEEMRARGEEVMRWARLIEQVLTP